MQRRLGTSILSVLSLTIGVLVAEYAFAPLREPYPATDKPVPPSDAESTASPREAEPAAPTDQNQPPPVERPDAAGEAEGDPLFASVARPVIDAVWQPSAGTAVRVSAASTAAFARSESSTIASSGGVSNLGGGFFSTGAGGSAPQSATPSRGGAGGTSAPGTSGSGTAPAVVEDSPTDPDTLATETLAMNTAPSTSVMDGAAATFPGETAMNTAPSSSVTDSPVTDGAIEVVIPDAIMAMNDAPASPPMDGMTDGMTDGTIGSGPSTEPVPDSVPSLVTPPEEQKRITAREDSMPPQLPPMSVAEPVEVPEPLSSSLFLLAVLLGGVQQFFSRNRVC